MSMFCYQCQETSKGQGCTMRGVCGKTQGTANLQDLLIYTLKGIAMVNAKARKFKINNKHTDRFIIDSLFSTITNVNFDKAYFVAKIKEALSLRDNIKKQLAEKGIDTKGMRDAVTWYADSEEEFDKKAMHVGILATADEDIRSLRSLILYGLKGMAAYATHAANLGYTDEGISEFIEKALIATLDDSMSADDYVALTLETGKHGVEEMALLDKANAESYGNPEITKVDTGVRKNPGILISGHDLKDLEELLEQTQGTGVDVYTHGEMLPAHYYPEFKKYPNFAGNYGNSWWMQNKEFDSFNGPIIMTTNCLIPPKDSYTDRLYTTGVVGFEGLKHIDPDSNGKKDFSEVIAQAKKCDPPTIRA